MKAALILGAVLVGVAAMYGGLYAVIQYGAPHVSNRLFAMIACFVAGFLAGGFYFSRKQS